MGSDVAAAAGVGTGAGWPAVAGTDVVGTTWCDDAGSWVVVQAAKAVVPARPVASSANLIQSWSRTDPPRSVPFVMPPASAPFVKSP